MGAERLGWITSATELYVKIFLDPSKLVDFWTWANVHLNEMANMSHFFAYYYKYITFICDEMSEMFPKFVLKNIFEGFLHPWEVHVLDP